MQLDQSEIGQGGIAEILNTGDIRFQCHDMLMQWNHRFQIFTISLNKDGLTSDDKSLFRFLCLPCDFSLCLACAETPEISETQDEPDFDIVSATETETLAGEELEK